jgi:hypothetical protein
MQGQNRLETWSKKTFSTTRVKVNLYNSHNLDPSRLFQVILYKNECFRFYIEIVTLKMEEKKRLHPVAFYLIKNLTTQINYEIHYMEFLLIVNSFQVWHHLLEGACASHQIIVFTNHNNLEHFMSTCVLNWCQAC